MQNIAKLTNRQYQGEKMKKFFIPFFILILTVLTLTSCIKEFKPEESDVKQIDYGLVIHGGAGWIERGRLSPEKEKAYRDKLNEALNVGLGILKNGGSGLDAVEKVINVLEDSPLFNAGKGAVLTAEGKCELDASIMDGKTNNAGAVAGVMRIKNPISLARKVMTESPHVMLAREGAEAFAEKLGFELVDNSYFYTEARKESLKKAQMKNNQTSNLEFNDYKYGTVGCVALDKDGNLAAGTSTGGMTNKMFGRVGDSPIIGAGTYANNKTCAISATGHGEFFIRNVVAHDISALMEYKGWSLDKAANKVINDKLVKQDASGGVIAIDRYGNISMPFNTPGMFRGYATSKEGPVVKMYKDE